jgi:hypothetical protein
MSENNFYCLLHEFEEEELLAYSTFQTQFPHLSFLHLQKINDSTYTCGTQTFVWTNSKWT